MCGSSLPIEILKKATPMTDNKAMEVLKRGLCVAVDMRDYATENGRTVTGRSSDFRI